MSALLQWISGQPARAFLAAGLVAMLAMFALPMAAWLPAAVVVFALLAGGTVHGIAAAAGGVAAFAAVFAPHYGMATAAALAIAALLPAGLAAAALRRTRSLNFVFQAATVGACVLVLAIHAVVGDPLQALAPLLAQLEPLLEQVAAAFARSGIESSPEQIGEAAARVAWGFLAWLVLAHALFAQFAGLWAFGRLREPGLFGREFRRLRLGRVIAWSLIGAFVVNVVSANAAGPGWLAAQDLVFVLSAAFLLQALAVLHGLRELQVVGIVPVALAYFAVLALPHLLVVVGLADTWFRFRERSGPGPRAAGA